MAIAVSSEPPLVLDNEAHRAYFQTPTGRVEAVRVTSALAQAGLADTTWFTEDSRRRGSAIAEGIAIDFGGGIVTAKHFPPAWRPFWCGYERFKAERRFVAYLSEQAIGDLGENYIGQLDLFGQFVDLPGEDVYDLVDVKSGGVPDYTALQTALYRRRVRWLGAHVARVRRWALQLP